MSTSQELHRCARRADWKALSVSAGQVRLEPADRGEPADACLAAEAAGGGHRLPAVGQGCVHSAVQIMAPFPHHTLCLAHSTLSIQTY